MFQQTHLFSKEVILYILHIRIQYCEKKSSFLLKIFEQTIRKLFIT